MSAQEMIRYDRLRWLWVQKYNTLELFDELYQLLIEAEIARVH